jgi:hypothetical protein
MSEIEIDVKLLAANVAKELNAISQAAKKTDDTFSGLGKTVIALNQGWELMGRVISKVTDVIDPFIDAAIEQERAVNELNVALQSIGTTSVGISQDLQAFASQLEKTSTFADEVTLSASAMFIQLTGTTKGVKEATIAAQNLASQFNLDLNSAMRIIAKSSEDSGAALKRYNIVVEQGATKSETLSNAIAAVNDKLGGVAASKINTYEGALKQAGNAFNNLLENIGNYIIKNPTFINAIKLSADAFTSLAKLFESPSQKAAALAQDELKVKLEEVRGKINEVKAALDEAYGSGANRTLALTNQLSSLKEQEAAYADQLIINDKKVEEERTLTQGQGLEERKQNKLAKLQEENALLQQETTLAGQTELEQQINLDLFKLEQKAKHEKDTSDLIAIETQKRELIEKKSAENRKKREELENQQRLQATQTAFGAIAAVAKEGGKKSFEVWKLAATAEAIIAGYLAVSKALASAPPPFNFIAAAAVGTLAALQVRNIQMAKPPEYATGGIVPGSSYSGDRVPAMVNSGEMILNREQQTQLFNSINGGGGGATFNIVINGAVTKDNNELIDNIIDGINTAVQFRNVNLRTA